VYRWSALLQGSRHSREKRETVCGGHQPRGIPVIPARGRLGQEKIVTLAFLFVRFGRVAASGEVVGRPTTSSAQEPARSCSVGRDPGLAELDSWLPGQEEGGWRRLRTCSFPTPWS